MARTKHSVQRRRRRKKTLKRTKGFFSGRSRQFRAANEAILHALSNAYRDRRLRKRDFRRLWISRINAAAREGGLSYSRFISGLKKAGVGINRKMLAELAISDPEAFRQLVDRAKGHLQV